MHQLKSVSIAALLLVVSAIPAHAGLLLRLDASATLVNSGDDVVIDATLVDDGTVSSIGLFSGSTRLLVNDGGTAVATIDSPLDITGNGAFINIDTIPFDFPFPELAPSGFTNLAGINQDIDLFGAPVFPTGGEIHLASYNVTVTGAAGSSVTLTSSSLGSSFAGVVGGDLATVFDPLMSDSVTVTIAGNVIPEPTSMAIFAIGIMSTVCAGRRRRRR